MERKRCTVSHRNISLAHGDVVEKQASLGPSTLLSYIQGCQIKVNMLTDPNPTCTSRLTILVVDNTLWPSRVLLAASGVESFRTGGLVFEREQL